MCKRPSLFGLICHRFLRPTCLQLGSQNPPKSLKSRCQDALYFALYFLIDVWSTFAPKLDLLDLKKRYLSIRKIRFFEKSPFEANIDFWSHCGFNIASFWHPKSTNIFQKIHSKRHYKIDQFWDRCLLDFGSVLGAKLKPCWPPLSAQDRPKGLQDPS